MDPKLLTENGWKATAQKFKIKDNGLQRALSVYEKLGDDKHDDRLKGIASVSQLAGALKKVKEVAAVPDVVKYLTNLLAAAQSEQREITQAKDQAGKKAEAEVKKQEQEQKQKAPQEEDGDEEEETGDSFEKLKKALQNLKASKVPYYFIACDAKPYGLIIAKRDITKSAQHKKELAAVAGGSTRPPKFGTCRRDGSKLIFEMDKPLPGMARIFQKWIKDCTGIGFKVMVGNESAEDEEGPAAGAAAEPPQGEAAGAAAPAAPAKGPLSLGASVGRGGKNKPEDVTAVQTALNNRVKAGLPEDGKCDAKTLKAIEDFQKLLGQFKPDGLIEPGRGPARALAGTGKLPPPPEPPKPIAPPKLPKPVLATAPQVWHGMRNILDTNIRELKKAISAEYANEHPDVLAAIDKNTTKLDVVFEKLDRRLADSLDRANGATDAAARKTELQNSKKILTEYIKYVKSEPLIDHIDSNPFGVDTKLEKLITDHLMHMAKSIGV